MFVSWLLLLIVGCAVLGIVVVLGMLLANKQTRLIGVIMLGAGSVVTLLLIAFFMLKVAKQEIHQPPAFMSSSLVAAERIEQVLPARSERV